MYVALFIRVKILSKTLNETYLIKKFIMGLIHELAALLISTKL